MAALAAPHVDPALQGEIAEVVRDIPGAEALKLSPSMRRDKRVAVRFNLVARKASQDVVPEEYTQKFDSSDNLKYALSSDSVADNQKPLGKRAATPPTGAGSGLASAH